MKIKTVLTLSAVICVASMACRPTGSAQTSNYTPQEAAKLPTALENLAKLSPDQLPEIPGKPNAPESWRRLAALHRELSRLRGKPTHFLAYRDAARVFDGMSHQEAHVITGALETLGVIEIVSKGKAGLNSRTAAEFRYLLAQSENGAPQKQNGC